MSEAMSPVESKLNPYVEQLSEELGTVLHAANGHEASRLLAAYVVDRLMAPKNKRIHELHVKLARVEAGITHLGKTLDRLAPGEWHKDAESPIDCAIRLLSPVRDDAPPRDRP